MFKITVHSHKTSACDRLAGQVETAIKAMGLFVERDKSSQSASQYLYVGPDEDALDLKIRVSDHDDRHGGSHWLYDVDAPLASIVERVAKHFGRAVPDGFRTDQIAARQGAGSKAAATRRQAATDWETAAVVTLIEAIGPDVKTPGKPALGKQFDSLFGVQPRAVRQRVVQAVIDRREREALEQAASEAVAAANGNIDQLVGLIIKAPYRSPLQRKAKEFLHGLVGDQTYAGLRPTGVSRSEWSLA